MATNAARIQSLFDAVLNKVASATQIDRFGQALAYSNQESEAYDAMTQGAKAAYVLEGIRRWMVATVKKMDAEKAEIAQRAAAATVDTEFAPSP
jgi:hypothetical protein